MCTYKMSITVVVTLNSTVYDFQNNVARVQTNFIQAIASAANVNASSVVINSITTANRRRSRNILSAVGNRNMHGMHGVCVHTTLWGAEELHPLHPHIKGGVRVIDHSWEARHEVHATAHPLKMHSLS